MHAGQGEFDMTKGHTNFTVRLQDKLCDYRKWKLTGLPCKHVARYIFRMKQQLEDYVEDCFIVDKYKNLYNPIVHPMATLQMWEKRNLPVLDHLFAKKIIGRSPKHKRKDSLNTLVPESKPQQIPHKVPRFGTARYKFHFILCFIYVTNLHH